MSTVAKPYVTLEPTGGPWLTSPPASPLIGRTAVLGLTTEPSEIPTNAQGVCTALYLPSDQSYAGQQPDGFAVDGQDTWYHATLALPYDYQPTAGDWNWLVEWHLDDHTYQHTEFSIALGVSTALPAPAGSVGVDPALVLRLAGGDSASPTYQNATAPGPFKQLYDLTFHFVWSASPARGLVEWFVDGQQVLSQPFPTLFTNPDASKSYNTFGLYNYHLDSSWASTVRFFDVAVGPSRASVTP
jgi:hypothetical protein